MPDLHPFLVHFPVALLVTSLILEILGFSRRFNELNRAGWWTQLFGSIGIVLAVLSGLLAGNNLTLGPGAQGSLDLHHQMAFASSAIFVVLLLWRISAKTEIPRHTRTAYLFLYVLGVILLIVGSWAGGVIVFQYGVGVNQP
ncbi:MAG: DUF2231 domain-containing protein [Bacteroidetes bacterium]|nr:DUF2231 domain-containing protein [Bacteroidota bacterium]